MYFTSFHKAVLRELWRNKDSTFNLEKFLRFYNNWYIKKNKQQVVAEISEKNTQFIFNGHAFSPDEGFLINPEDERKIELAFCEFNSLMDYLSENDLIHIIRPKEATCLPIFLGDKNKPFNRALTIVSKYIGKEILVRAGYNKFRRFNYSTHEEILRLLIAIWFPVLLALITAILSYFFS